MLFCLEVLIQDNDYKIPVLQWFWILKSHQIKRLQ